MRKHATSQPSIIRPHSTFGIESKVKVLARLTWPQLLSQPLAHKTHDEMVRHYRRALRPRSSHKLIYVLCRAPLPPPPSSPSIPEQECCSCVLFPLPFTSPTSTVRSLRLVPSSTATKRRARLSTHALRLQTCLAADQVRQQAGRNILATCPAGMRTY